MNSFMSWVGGKKSLRDVIIPRFPLFYERYIEVFGGGGWILFGKPPNNDFEVYNDFNSNLANLFCCVRYKPQELIDDLTFVLNSREDFDQIKHLAKIQSPIGDVDRASKFYQLIRYSYASGCDSFGCQPHSMWNNFPLIEQASRRLQNVVIENKDFEKLIRQYDRPISFFYCDPPYYATEDYYDNVGFTEIDHIRLRDTLFGIQGKFMISYNDCDFIRSLYEKTDIQIQSFTRINNIKQRYEGGSQYAEILITNYDMSERMRSIPEQLSFADTD